MSTPHGKEQAHQAELEAMRTELASAWAGLTGMDDPWEMTEAEVANAHFAEFYVDEGGWS